MLPKASKANNWHYNPALKQRASEFRNHPTRAEAHLWHEVLKHNRLKYSFMRQRPILRYIADFFCKELMLLIEVDGGVHLSDAQQARDLVRQQELESVGFRMLRFWNDEVLEDTERVRAVIEGWISENRFL
ncbi:MAG: endonuclease domain-containing protein [Bacteroidia bacterium]|nr:endonuclease domain-containing protein [Bacteroidia bacterium]